MQLPKEIALKYYLLICLLLFLGACTPKKIGDTPVAQVGEQVLYLSDVTKIIPPNTGKDDSILFADNYINKWIKQKLLIKKANENLTAGQKNVSQELEEYKNSLIIYRYKNALVKQRLDTIITPEQIQEYYSGHKPDFRLKHAVVKAVFIKTLKEVANPDLLKNAAFDNSEEGQSELKDYCSKYAKNFQNSANNWIDFQLLNRYFPQAIENPAQIAKEEHIKEAEDSTYYYFLCIHDYIPKNEQAPIDFVENNIKNLILNQRKINLLKDLEENIYNEGERNKKFKIYNNAHEDK